MKEQLSLRRLARLRVRQRAPRAPDPLRPPDSPKENGPRVPASLAPPPTIGPGPLLRGRPAHAPRSFVVLREPSEDAPALLAGCRLRPPDRVAAQRGLV